LKNHLSERHRRGDLIRPHESGRHGVARRLIDRGEGRRQGNQRVDLPQARPARQGERGERDGIQDEQPLGHEHYPAPIQSVDERPAQHGEDDQRHHLGQPDQAHCGGRAGDREYLKGHCDDAHVGSAQGDDLSQPQRAEGNRLAQRRDVQRQRARVDYGPCP
jgi:hypothetical protein